MCAVLGNVQLVVAATIVTLVAAFNFIRNGGRSVIYERQSVARKCRVVIIRIHAH